MGLPGFTTKRLDSTRGKEESTCIRASRIECSLQPAVQRCTNQKSFEGISWLQRSQAFDSLSWGGNCDLGVRVTSCTELCNCILLLLQENREHTTRVQEMRSVQA